MIRFPDRGILRILAIALFAASCTDGGAPTGPDDLGIQSTVFVNYQAGNGDQFAFLQPLVKGKASGPLATGLSPIVEICNISSGAPTDCIQLEADEEPDHYHANWKDKTAQPNEQYSIEVQTSFGFVLGNLTLLLDGASGDKAGRTFPIKFWIGEQLGETVASTEACVADDRCNADDVPPGETTVITTQDDLGNGTATMAQLTFDPEDVPEGGLVVTLDCRIGGFEPTEGPLSTALDQWPLFCNVTASNPDGSPFTGQLPSEEGARFDACVVDDFLQPDYHAFPDPDALVLAKSNGPGDFVFLEKVPSIFDEDDCAGNTTPVPGFGLGDRLLHELDTRLAPAFSLLMPEGLRAAPMYFRDGGVGGLLRSFSDINPVEPAVIEGTVSHPSAPIQGVTVTLSGDASASTTTDANGFYQFSPLQAAPDGGSNYTVTATPPPGETFVDPDVDVLVTGTGTTTVDFETALPEGIFFFGGDGGTGNYYQAFETPVPWATADANADALPAFRSCNAQLVSILSAGEDAFIVENMPQVAQAGIAGSGGNGGYWLGGLQPDGNTEPRDGWKWISDGSFPGDNFGTVYANWAGGEPNNAGGVVGDVIVNAEDRLQYMGDWAGAATEKVRWNDEPGGRAYGYVVEYVCGPVPG